MKKLVIFLMFLGVTNLVSAQYDDDDYNYDEVENDEGDYYNANVVARTNYRGLYDIVKDQFLYFSMKHVERRNISPDCDERVTDYPQFQKSSLHPGIVTANARLERLYQYYMSDTFVDELQGKFHKIITTYQKNFPSQLNCINSQKVYAVNFKIVNVDITSCMNGKISIINSLQYTVANTPISALSNNFFHEMLLVDLNTGQVTRNQVLVPKAEQADFMKKVRVKLNNYVLEYRSKGGVENASNNMFIDLHDQVEIAGDYGNKPESDPEPEVYVVETDEIVESDNNDYEVEVSKNYDHNNYRPEITPVLTFSTDKNKKLTGIEKAITALKFEDLIIYWNNLSLVVRVSPYADMASYLVSGITEVEFTLCELDAATLSIVGNLPKELSTTEDEKLLTALKRTELEQAMPYISKPPQNLPGVKVLKTTIGSEAGSYSSRIVDYHYDSLGRLESVWNYQGIDRKNLSNRTKYEYDKRGELVRTIYYERNGSARTTLNAGYWNILEKKCNYYLLSSNTNALERYRAYYIGNRVILEPALVVDINRSHESTRVPGMQVIKIDREGKKLQDFKPEHLFSVQSYFTEDVLTPVVNKYYYDEKENLIVHGNNTAEFNKEGQQVFYGSEYLYNTNELVYDKFGRLVEIRSRTAENSENFVKYVYSNESSKIPSSVHQQNMSYPQTRITIEAEMR